jgi:hypothetical protein
MSKKWKHAIVIGASGEENANNESKELFHGNIYTYTPFTSSVAILEFIDGAQDSSIFVY